MYDQFQPWGEAARGLRIIATAMVISLVAVAMAALMIIVAVKSRSVGAVQTMTILVGLSGIVAQMAFALGVFRFSRQPPPAPGAAMAQAAGALALIGLLLAGYVFFVVLQITGIDENTPPATLRSTQEAAEALPMIEIAAVAIGFVSMMLLLGGCSAVAAHIGRRDLQEKARTGLVLVAFSGGIYALIKLIAKADEADTVVLFGLFALALQIAAFGFVLSCVRGLASGVLHPPRGELPRARAL